MNWLYRKMASEVLELMMEENKSPNNAIEETVKAHRLSYKESEEFESFMMNQIAESED